MHGEFLDLRRSVLEALLGKHEQLTEVIWGFLILEGPGLDDFNNHQNRNPQVGLTPRCYPFGKNQNNRKNRHVPGKRTLMRFLGSRFQ